MQKPNILVDYGLVFIEDQAVMRPENMGASDWCAFWEQVQLLDTTDDIIEIKQKLHDALLEIRELENTVEALREEIYELEHEP